MVTTVTAVALPVGNNYSFNAPATITPYGVLEQFSSQPNGKSAVAEAIEVLRRFGTDAHIWLPGVGSINGLQTANYLLSDASTGLAPVDQYVGRVNDALGGLGAELVSFSYVVRGTVSGTTQFTLTTTSVATTEFGVVVALPLAVAVAGKSYRITSKIVSKSVVDPNQVITAYVSSGQNSGISAKMHAITAAGHSSVYAPATTSTITIRTEGGTATIGDSWVIEFSVREVTGIHATQPTAANRPKLVQTNNKYAWVFDGVNDSLALSSAPFQMGDDHCVIAAGVNYASTGDRYLFDGGNTVSSNAMVCSLVINNTQPKVYWRDDAAGNQGVSGVVGSIPIGSVAVISARKLGTSGVLRLNGLQVGVAATVTLGVTTCTHSAIGVRAVPGNYFNGNIGPVIAIKGTVSNSDLLLLEKLVGALSGVAIP